MMGIRTVARKLARNESGMGFVELALAAPLMALLFLGMVDLSKVVAARIDLEQAAQRTTDYVLAKRPRDANTSEYVAEAAAAAGVPTSDVTIDLYLECSGTRAASFTGVCTAGQTTHRFVSVAISEQVNTGFNWRALGSLFSGGSDTYRPITVTGDSLVRIQ